MIVATHSGVTIAVPVDDPYHRQVTSEAWEEYLAGTVKAPVSTRGKSARSNTFTSEMCQGAPGPTTGLRYSGSHSY